MPPRPAPSTPARKRPRARPKADAAMFVLRKLRVVFNTVKGHFREVEKKTGVAGAQVWAMAVVRDQPGLGVNDLARAMDIHQSTASNLLRQLQQLSLVERRRRGKDQRSVQIFVTGRGRALLRRSPQPFIGVLQQALTELPDANLASMHRQLARLIKSMAGKNLAARATPLSDL